jgi:antitoxin component YwqK of YwqJK toxin-antitoxin module
MRTLLVVLCAVFIAACSTGSKSPEEQKAFEDSIAKVRQKHLSDSLKKANPLLIMPPDSDYTGEYVDKYPSGVVKFRGQFRFGERHGHWMSFFPNGKLWSEMEYDKGVRHGQNITYYITGQTRYSGFYKNDMQDSLWCYYDSTGQLSQKVLYKNDRIAQKLPLK